jgi:hypothetical protein
MPDPLPPPQPPEGALDKCINYVEWHCDFPNEDIGRARAELASLRARLESFTHEHDEALRRFNRIAEGDA